MQVKFLIHITKQRNKLWSGRCPATSAVSAACRSRQEAMDDLSDQLTQFLQVEGKSYIASWKGKLEVINCPEGFLELPIDIWKCKLSKEICPAQAQVYIKDKAKLLNGCLAPEEEKDAIYETIKNSKYDGFHHIPGRYKCPLCINKRYKGYHYPWELTHLSKFFDIYDNNFRIRFLEENLDLAAYSNALCPACVKNIISTIDSKLGQELEILELDLYG